MVLLRLAVCELPHRGDEADLSVRPTYAMVSNRAQHTVAVTSARPAPSTVDSYPRGRLFTLSCKVGFHFTSRTEQPAHLFAGR